MPRLGNINQYEQKKAQQQPAAMPASMAPSQDTTQSVPATPATPLSTEVMRRNIGQAYFNEPQISLARPMDMQKPELKIMAPEKLAESQRNNYMQSFDTWEEAEKRGNISQKAWANAKIQELIAKGENPGEYLNMLSIVGSSETPEEKAKRERREQLGEVFNNLGNLIGNAANLYYTTKGGQYIDLNAVNEKHRARMERLREKQEALKQRQDELLGKAKLSDIQAGRAERAAKVKADADAKAKELDYKRDLALKQIEHALRIGQIDAQTAANMKRDAAKATSDKELEAFKQSNRITLKTTPSYGESKVVDSAIGADGNIYTRNSRLTDNEAMQIVLSSVPDDEFSQFVTTDENGRERTDWRAAAAYALQKGYVSEDELKQMGFKRGKTSKKKDGNSLGIGIGNNNNNGNKLGIGL